MDRLQLRRPTAAPTAILDVEPAPVGRPVRALARPRRRPAAVRLHAAVRGVAARPTCCASRPRWPPRPARTGRPTCPRTATRSREVARLFPEAIDYLDVYDRAGGLGPRTILAHAIHLRTREVARLAETGTRVAHCPASNLFLASGAMPLARYLAAGIRVGPGLRRRGRPGAVDLREHARRRLHPERRCACSPSGDAATPTPLGPLDWLRLGTLEGARALGLEDAIGSLEAGKEADLIAVDPRLVAPVAGHRLRRPGRDHVAARLPAAPGDGPRRLGPRPAPGRPAGPVRRSTRDRRRRPPDRGRHGRRRHRARPGTRGAVAVVGDSGPAVVRPADDAVDVRAGRTRIDATGHRRRARVHRPPQPRRPDDPRRAAPRAEGPPGRHDRAHRRRRQRLRAVPGRQHDLDDFADPQRRPRRAARRSRYDWATVAELPRPLRRRGVASTSPTSSATRRCGSRPSAGTTSRPTHAPMADQRALLREAMEEGAFGLSTGLDYPPGAYATTDGAGRARWPRPRKLGGIYHTHVRYPLGDRFLDPFREAIEIGRRGRRRRSTSPTSTTGRRSRARPSRCSALVDDARAEGLDVTLRPLPLRVGEHAAPDHAADLDPGRRRRPRSRSASPTGRSARRIRDELAARGRLFAGASARGTTCASGYFARPEHRALGGPDAGRRHAPRRAATRSTRSATCSSPRTCGSTR